MTTHPGRHDAFNIITATEARAGRILRSQPAVFFTSQMENAWLGHAYAGATAFLVCGGPSAGAIDLKALSTTPGIITMAVNNAAQGWRPQLWCGLDEPHRFLNSIWLDPGIQKFYPLAYQDMPLRDHPVRTPKDCPNTWFIRRNDKFDAKTWLHEDTINWGQEGDDHRRGGRSTMVAAMRILYILGFKRVYLIGADFKMDPKKAYNHDQVVDATVADKNNTLFEYLNGLFTQLQVEFLHHGFEVFNTTQISGLTAFPYKSFIDARAQATNDSKVNPRESSAGLYDGHFKEPAKPTQPRIAPPILTDSLRDLAWGYSAGLGIAEVKAAWDAYTAELAVAPAGKSTERLVELEDKALAAAGIPPRNGAWNIPATTRPLKIDTDKHDGSRRAFIVGNGSTANAGEGWRDDGMRSDDVVIRINFPRLDGYPVGDRTDYWVLNPQHPRALEDLEIGLAMLKPWRVVLIQPRVLENPAQGARYAEVLSRLRHISANKPDVWDPAYAKRRLQPPVVHETWGLSTGAEAIRWARTWADTIVTTGIDTHIAPKIEPKRIRYWGEPATGTYTPQERLYLRLLKQAGGFSDLEGFDLEPLDPPTADEATIPKIIHIMAIGTKIEGEVAATVAKNIELLESLGWDVNLWQDTPETATMVTSFYEDDLGVTVAELPHDVLNEIAKPAALRMGVGGLCIDADVEVIRDPSALCAIGAGAFGFKDFDGKVRSRVVGAAYGSVTIEAWADSCKARIKAKETVDLALDSVLSGNIRAKDFVELPWWYFDPAAKAREAGDPKTPPTMTLVGSAWDFRDGVGPYTFMTR
jgi:hypothetical protein